MKLSKKAAAALAVSAAALAACSAAPPGLPTQTSDSDPVSDVSGVSDISNIDSGSSPAGYVELAAGTDYAKGTVLRMATVFKGKKTGITFDAETAGNGITLADGKTYHAGELKPTFQELQNRLDIRFTDINQGSTYVPRGIEDWQARLDEVDIGSGYAYQFNDLGALGELVDLSEHLDKMPNFKAFLDANPIIRLSITSSDAEGNLGAIYYSPYCEGVNDVQRMPLMRTDWVEKLLNGSGRFTAEKCGTTSAPSYQPYMPDSGKIVLEVVKADGSGTDQITKNYEKFGNIIDKMNKAGAMNGVDAVNMLRDYIDKTYEGYYGTNRADLFIGQNAAWDADELAALLRCVVANAQTLNGTDTVSGIFCRQADDNTRRTDMFRLAGVLFGARGLHNYYYLGSDNKIHDSRMEEQTYNALERMHALAQEGLIDEYFMNDAAMTSEQQLREDHGFMSYDFSQTQTLFNDTVLQDGEEYRAVMIPVARWYDGSNADGKYMRFTESWRSVLTSGWAISAPGVDGSKDKLNAALKLIDYAYSEEGQILMSYGPDAFIKQDPNGEYVTFDLNGEQHPKISDDAYAELWEKCGGIHTDYSRQYIGSNLSFIKAQSYEYQCTTERGRIGLDHISRALELGTVKHPQLSFAANPWYTALPTVLPIIYSYNDLIFPEPDYERYFRTGNNENNLLVSIIAKGYSGSGYDISDKADVINKVKTSWNGNHDLELEIDAWERLLNSVQ